MHQNKIVLITGAAGFLGSWLADECIENGYTIIGIDIHGPLRPQIWSRFATSSCETVDLDQLLKDYKLYAICHLAGGASVPSSITNPYGDFVSLLPGTTRLALYIAKNQPQARVFLFSSAAVYGNPYNLPVPELSPILPISPYGIHKAIAETILGHYSRVLNIKVTIFRIFSVYGPGLRKQLIWDVSQRALRASQTGQQSIILHGDGNESRDFIYVRDLCNAVLLIMAQKDQPQYEVFNLASGVEISISDTAQCLIKHLNVNVDVSFNGIVPLGNPINWRADIEKLKNLGFKQQYSLDLGLEQVVRWVKSNINL